jgi:hypothetical protein
MESMTFAPGLVGAFSGGDDGGGGCQGPSLPMNGNRSWRGSSGARGRRRLSEGRRRFAPCERSCFVRQPLALGADDGAISSGLIVDSERNAIVVPEIELGRVAMQMRFADVEIATIDAAFEDREEVLDRVGVPEGSPHVLLRGVVDRAVPSELASDRPIDCGIVGHQIARFVDVRDDDRLEDRGGNVRNVEMEAADFAIALHQAQHRSFGRDLAFSVGGSTADVSFVGLDNLILATKRRVSSLDLQHGHCFTNAMAEEPCGFEAAAEGPMKLAGRDALLAAAHQVDGLKPDMHRHVARLKHSPHAHSERLPAGAAFPKAGARALAFQLRCFAYRAAVRTERAIGPQSAFDIGDSGFFVAELRGVKGGLHGGFPCSAIILPIEIGMSSVTLPNKETVIPGAFFR